LNVIGCASEKPTAPISSSARATFSESFIRDLP
jgi:hypothetical protein